MHTAIKACICTKLSLCNSCTTPAISLAVSGKMCFAPHTPRLCVLMWGKADSRESLVHGWLPCSTCGSRHIEVLYGMITFHLQLPAKSTPSSNNNTILRDHFLLIRSVFSSQSSPRLLSVQLTHQHPTSLPLAGHPPSKVQTRCRNRPRQPVVERRLLSVLDGVSAMARFQSGPIPRAARASVRAMLGERSVDPYLGAGRAERQRCSGSLRRFGHN